MNGRPGINTPRNWTFGVYDATPNFRAIKQRACVCESDTMALIATCGPAEDPESQKQAELFAAAPEMLATLETVLFRLENLDENWFLDGEIKMLRAAIAKAKGES